jgi:hypothetical protein
MQQGHKVRHFILIMAIFWAAILPSGFDMAAASERVYVPDYVNLDDDERIIDGFSFTPLWADTKVAGVDIELETSVVREMRAPAPASPSTAALPVSPVHEGSAVKRAARVTDIRISARRSFALNSKFFVDALARAELPTGNVQAGLGQGRTEFMADLGVRSEIGKFSLWAGGARKANLKTQWSSGRDVNEVYAGWNAKVGKTSNLRMDFVSTQKRESYLPREQSLSAEFSKSFGKGKRVAVYAGQYKGPWGKDVSAGATIRFKLG